MKNDTPEHPKMFELAVALHIDLAHAVGLMEMLWHFTATYAPQGDIGKFDDAHIARAIHWKKNAATIIEALTAVHWIDLDETHRLVVHDWPDHCERGVHTWLARRRLTFWNGRRPDLSQLTEGDRSHAHADYEAGLDYPSDKHNRSHHAPIDTDNPPFPEQWDEFWGLWPKLRKHNKQPALKSWCKIVHSESMALAIINGVRIQLQPGGVLDRPDPKHIPYAVTWLNNHRWDEPYTPSQKDIDNQVLDREPTMEDLMVSLGAKPVTAGDNDE